MRLPGGGSRARGAAAPLALFLLGVLARCWALGAVPGGLNQDEAFAGYEAWSLLTSGVDCWGYPWPCYFVSWGSGMNVLESYLAIPFMALLGCTETALRLPQLICACACLPVFYDLLRRMASRRLALIGQGLLAISPWHIMLSRWGLESNLAPAFLLFGFYFLVRGLEDDRFLPASAAAYGLSLYAYAINWVVVPLTLCVCGGYLLLSGRRFRMGRLLGAAGILFLLALPLMLFVLVNLGVMGEIVTPWFSVPRLAAMRDGELSLANLLSPEGWRGLAQVVFLQRDGLIWNGVEGFGMFYPISLPFQLLGAARLIRGAAGALRAKRYDWQCLALLWAGCGAAVCLAVANLNITRANSLYLLLPALYRGVFHRVQPPGVRRLPLRGGGGGGLHPGTGFSPGGGGPQRLLPPDPLLRPDAPPGVRGHGGICGGAVGLYRPGGLRPVPLRGGLRRFGGGHGLSGPRRPGGRAGGRGLAGGDI